MKKYMKAIALLLAVLVASALITGCGGSNQSGGGTTSAGTQTASVAESPAAQPETETAAAAAEPAPADSGASESSAIAGVSDWRTPYPETVTVTMVNVEDPTRFFPEGEDYYNNLWTKRWKDLYNVEVKTDWISSDYDAKLNLSIASGQLPDMFYCNSAQFQQLIEANALADLAPTFDANSSPGLKNLLRAEPEVEATAIKNGARYAIPKLHYGYTCQPGFLWIREDYMIENGNPDVSTVDKFENLMRTFMEKYDQPYALTCDKDLNPFWYSTNGWHAYMKDGGTRLWVDDGNGGIMSGYEMLPEVKDALSSWSSWHKEGLLRPDFATAGWDDMVADIVGGTTGLEIGAQWKGWAWFDIVKNFGNDAYLRCYDIPSIDGKEVHYGISFLNTAYNVVTKGCKNPEVLAKLCSDYVYILNEATVEGTMTSEEVLPFTSNNMHHVTGPFKLEFPSYEDTKEVIAAYTTGNPVFTTGYARSYYDELMKWVTDKDISSLGRWLQMGNERASLVMGNGYQDRGLWIFTKAWGAAPQEELDLGGITDSIISEGVTKIIMGVEPVDYYDTVIAEWRAAGGDEMKQAINAAYGQ
jgi:putative aldouronate transport system substrate-binding protein